MTLSNKQQKLLRIAISNAGNSTMQNQHGSVLAFGNKAISNGHNHLRAYINGQPIVSCHAEIDALHRYLRQFRQYELHGQEAC